MMIMTVTIDGLRGALKSPPTPLITPPLIHLHDHTNMYTLTPTRTTEENILTMPIILSSPLH
jgi:hypothetical protein